MCGNAGLVCTFGAMEPVAIFRNICEIVENDQDVTLSVRKSITSVFFYGEKVFSFRINSKTQCLDTEEAFIYSYVERISGGKVHRETKTVYAEIPLLTDGDSVPVVQQMLRDLLQECFNRQNVGAFGCCNDHVRCSDAGRCLHAEDKFYLGCMYRRNLEAGRIFYGRNRNVEDKQG